MSGESMDCTDVVYDSEEAIEARGAFLEKRAPDFSRFR
jgi:1,4-dihydroxy-2-naphthoyl-CoA synthase